MRLKVKEIEAGIHPSQVVVSIAAKDGPHFLVVDRSAVRGGAIEVGHSVGIQGEYRLVELPEETDDGRWRLWVMSSDLTENHLEAAE